MFKFLQTTEIVVFSKVELSDAAEGFLFGSVLWRPAFGKGSGELRAEPEWRNRSSESEDG